MVKYGKDDKDDKDGRDNQKDGRYGRDGMTQQNTTEMIGYSGKYVKKCQLQMIFEHAKNDKL